MPTNTLPDWFETPLGQYLLEKERAYLDDVTPDIFGFHALQLGMAAGDERLQRFREVVEHLGHHPFGLGPAETRRPLQMLDQGGEAIRALHGSA